MSQVEQIIARVIRETPRRPGGYVEHETISTCILAALEAEGFVVVRLPDLQDLLAEASHDEPLLTTMRGALRRMIQAASQPSGQGGERGAPTMTPDIGRVSATELLAEECAKEPPEIDLLSDDVPPVVTEAAALRAIEAACASERAAVVAWLRSQDSAAAYRFATAIEQGKHQGGGE